MAVQPQTPYKEFTANGSTKNFALEFDCENQDHLIVLVDDIEPVVGTWSLSGGAVVFDIAPASGKKITIQRNTPFRRDEDFQSYDNSFRPPGVNKGFDKIWLKLQELGVADWILSSRIDALKNYVDDRDDELRGYLMEEIRKQGVALDQLDDYYNYLMQQLAQIAVNKGWLDSFVVTWSGRTQEDKNRETLSILDFGGVEGETCPRLSSKFATLAEAKAAYPTVADKITSLDLYVNDVAALLVRSENFDSVILPNGVFKFKDNYSFPADLAFTTNDQSYIKFDNYYWIRRWDGGTQKQTVHVYFDNQADVTTFVNDIQELITWIAPNTFTVTSTAPASTTNWKINVANAKMCIGKNFTYPRVNTVLNLIPRNFSPSNEIVNGITDYSTGASNVALGTSSLESLTTGAGNTAAGASSGGSLTTGTNNNFFGFQSGHRVTTGQGNDGFGCLSLEHLTDGSFNTAIGFNAQGSKRTGINNVSVGGETLWSWDSGNNNSAFGYRALANGAGTGENNVAIGTFSQDFGAGTSNTSVGYRALNGQGGVLTGNDNTVSGAFSCRYLAGSSSRNTAYGSFTLGAETGNSDLSAFGYSAMAANKGGLRNSAFGTNSIKTNIVGSNNSGFGFNAGILLTSSGNSLFGAYTGANITTGNDNSSMGDRSGQNLTTGSSNTSFGARSLDVENTGGNNTALGFRAGMLLNGSSQNTAVGSESLRLMQDGTNATSITNSSGLGSDARVSGSNQVQLGNSITTTYVYGTVQNRSDARDKADVRDTTLGLDFICSLRPVDYKWDMREDYIQVDEDGNVTKLDKDGSKKRNRFHHGFIAQEVKALADQLGVDFGGYQDHALQGGSDVLSIGYDEFIAPTIKAIQQISERLDAIEQRLAAANI